MKGGICKIILKPLSKKILEGGQIEKELNTFNGSTFYCFHDIYGNRL